MSQMCDCSLLDSIVDVLQHVLVKVFISIHTFQVFLELLLRETKTPQSNLKSLVKIKEAQTPTHLAFNAFFN